MKASTIYPTISYPTNTIPTTNPAKQPNFYMFLLTALLTLAVIYGVHAVEKHKEEAEQVRICIEKNGYIQRWIKPNGRIVLICRMPDLRFGVQIRDPWDIKEITSFIKNKMSRLSQVEKWLDNQGATRLP